MSLLKRIGAATGILGAVLSTGVQCDSQAVDQIGKNTDKIVYVSDRTGDAEIWTMNLDGSGQNRLTSNPASDRKPRWDRIKVRIVFSSSREGGMKIFKMYGDGSGVTQLTTTNSLQGLDDAPSWSPDSAQICFSSNRDGNYEIYKMNSDGSNQVRLTNNQDSDDGPCWSPDGGRIAFFSNRSGSNQIYVMNIDGSNQQQITSSQGQNLAPTWSDNDKIAFLHKGSDVSGYYVVNPDGSGYGPGGGYGGIPDWDFVGENLIFDNTSNSGGIDIFRVNIFNGDGHITQITDFGVNFHNVEPNW